MISLDTTVEVEELHNYKTIILTRNFLAIYGLPFCLLYYQHIANLYPHVVMCLDVGDYQGTATLAVIDNFPNLLVSSGLTAELNVIKNNCGSTTKLFDNIHSFKDSL